MKFRNNIAIGLFFIIFGMVFLLNNMGVLNIYLGVFDVVSLINKYWPVIFVLVPGILLHAFFFMRKGNDSGILIPAGFFTVFGIVLQVTVAYSTHGIIWSGFFLSLAVAFLEMYMFGGKYKKVLIPVYMFTALSILLSIGFFLRELSSIHIRQIILSFILIALGIYIFVRKK